MKKLFLMLFSFTLVFFLASCGGDSKPEPENIPGEDVARSPEKDIEIQRYNLQRMRDQTVNRTPCDTIALIEYVLDNYPEGTYLVDFDRTFAYNVPKPAVFYYSKNREYVFGVIARSKPGERLIEAKNVVGWDQSFIDLDSTELGTAFFYLVLFRCEGDQFSIIWEAPIPSHGGFNRIYLNKWKYKGTEYMQSYFHYARGSGHIDYNYFFVNGLTSFPHLLMTYEGINFKRTIANVNDDKYPDYYEHVYVDYGDSLRAVDSIAFVWNEKDSVYINTRNKKITRPY